MSKLRKNIYKQTIDKINQKFKYTILKNCESTY